MNPTHMNKTGKVGVMVVGHREYWPQFPELRGRLLKNAEGFESLLKKQGVEVLRFTNDDGTQMCDSPEGSYKAGVYFKTQDVDLVFLFLTCYVASGRYMQGLLACPAPVVVVGYQKAQDFATSTRFDENAGGGACPVSEACNALTRCLKSAAGVVFGEYYGDGGFAPNFEKDISDWCRVADTLRMYRGAIFGHMGHSYEGMLDMNFDPTMFTRTFGVHIRMVEMCELAKYVQEASLVYSKLTGIPLLADCSAARISRVLSKPSAPLARGGT